MRGRKKRESTEDRLASLVERLRRRGVDELLVGEVAALRAGYNQTRIMLARYRADNERLSAELAVHTASDGDA